MSSFGQPLSQCNANRIELSPDVGPLLLTSARVKGQRGVTGQFAEHPNSGIIMVKLVENRSCRRGTRVVDAPMNSGTAKGMLLSQHKHCVPGLAHLP